MQLDQRRQVLGMRQRAAAGGGPEPARHRRRHLAQHQVLVRPLAVARIVELVLEVDDAPDVPDPGGGKPGDGNRAGPGR